MKLLFSLLLIGFILTGTAFSQEKEASQRAQTVYGEFLGNGVVFSGNYDFRILKKQNGLGMRLGLGFFGGSGGGVITVPVGLNYLFGNGPHYFEAGFGYTYAAVTESDDFGTGSGQLLIPTIGYRYQPLKNGFTARAYIGPLIGIGAEGGWLFWGGFSVGYKF